MRFIFLTLLSFILPTMQCIAQPASTVATNGMVVTAEKHASHIGVEIMKQGGNAIDASVAVGFALAVTLPHAGNLGGGGFMLIYNADKKEFVAIDYREMAPTVTGSPYAIPGTVAGLVMAQQIFGKLSLDEVIQPAIKLAEEGFPVSEELTISLWEHGEFLTSNQATYKSFYKSNGSFYEPNEILKQQDLATTLKLIAKKGSKAFYRGQIADKIVAGTTLTYEDLKSYYPKLRRPLLGKYRGYDIITMPPPSSGGATLIQLLNILEQFKLGLMGQGSTLAIHTLAETMKLAFADRNKYMADSDFVSVPMDQLMSKLYASRLAKGISRYSATPAKLIEAGTGFTNRESLETTHFNVADKWGNIVSNTYTLSSSYGSGKVVEGTGFLMNSAMKSFASAKGAPNSISPRKRPLSSMAPTFVFKDGKFILATGSIGSSHIITSILQVITGLIDHQLTLAEATSAVRVHHQWIPDRLLVEKGLKKETIIELEDKGHNVVTVAPMGTVQTIVGTKYGYVGANDIRGSGSLALGY